MTIVISQNANKEDIWRLGLISSQKWDLKRIRIVKLTK